MIRRGLESLSVFRSIWRRWIPPFGAFLFFTVSVHHISTPSHCYLRQLRWRSCWPPILGRRSSTRNKPVSTVIIQAFKTATVFIYMYALNGILILSSGCLPKYKQSQSRSVISVISVWTVKFCGEHSRVNECTKRTVKIDWMTHIESVFPLT